MSEVPVQPPCPNCGILLIQEDGPCPRCGWKRSDSGMKWVWGCLTLFIGVPSLLVGGCFFIVADVTGSSNGSDPGFFLIAAIGFLIFLALVILFARSFRR